MVKLDSLLTQITEKSGFLKLVEISPPGRLLYGGQFNHRQR